MNTFHGRTLVEQRYRSLQLSKRVCSVLILALGLASVTALPATAASSCSSSIGFSGKSLAVAIDVEEGATLASASTKKIFNASIKKYQGTMARATRTCKSGLAKAKASKNRKMKRATTAVDRVVARVAYNVSKVHRISVREAAAFDALQQHLARTGAALELKDKSRGKKQYRSARVLFRKNAQTAHANLNSTLMNITTQYSTARSSAIATRDAEVARAGANGMAISVAWDKYESAIRIAASNATSARKNAVLGFKLSVSKAQDTYEDEVEGEEEDDDDD